VVQLWKQSKYSQTFGQADSERLTKISEEEVLMGVLAEQMEDES